MGRPIAGMSGCFPGVAKFRQGKHLEHETTDRKGTSIPHEKGAPPRIIHYDSPLDRSNPHPPILPSQCGEHLELFTNGGATEVVFLIAFRAAKGGLLSWFAVFFPGIEQAHARDPPQAT